MQERASRLARAALAVLVLVTCGLVSAETAWADRGGESAVTVVPAAGRPGALRLRSQTVDITVSEDDTGVWADTRVRLQVSNPLTRTVNMNLALPGPQVAPGALPSGVQVNLDGAAAPLQPAPEPALGWTVPVTVTGKAELAVQVAYRQALSETQGLVTLAYPLAAAGKWGGAPESLRVAVGFAVPLAGEQLLGLAPPPRQQGHTLIWSWSWTNAPDVWLAFLSPSWWRKFAAAQTAAAAPEATAAEHLALSEMYLRLASIGPLSFAPELDFYGRYNPSAMAELQAVTKAGAGQPPGPEQMAAHSRLALLYADQANRLGQGGGDTYLELAAGEAQAALALGADDPGLRKLATDAYMQLAGAAQVRGDAGRADGYLARLTELQPAAEQAKQQARLALAASQLTRGDLDAARAIMVETFGAEAIDVPALRAPVAGQVLVRVETTVEALDGDAGGPEGAALSGRRRVSATLIGGSDAAALQALIDQAAHAWRNAAGAAVSSGPDWLAVEIQFRDEQALADTQTRLARLLPNLAELALMRAALTPDAVALRASDTRFQRTWQYAEPANLEPAAATWQQRATEIRAASLRLAEPAAAAPPAGRPGETATAAPDLGQVQRTFWEANAGAWEKLAQGSYVQYSVQLSDSGPARAWQVPAGTYRMLAAERQAWLEQPLALLAAGSILGLALVGLALWRLL